MVLQITIWHRIRQADCERLSASISYLLTSKNSQLIVFACILIDYWLTFTLAEGNF